MRSGWPLVKVLDRRRYGVASVWLSRNRGARLVSTPWTLQQPRRSASHTAASPYQPGGLNRHAADAAAAESRVVSQARAVRGSQIRRREHLLRWLRRLVLPAFTIYGLFVLRPTEGHFLRYTAERRHLDESFNAWFPPITRSTGTVRDGRRDTTAPSPHSRWFGSSFLPKEVATSTVAKVDDGGIGVAPLRGADDRKWITQAFKVEPNSPDEQRITRRRLLFDRDKMSLDDDATPFPRDTANPLGQPASATANPPMHLVSNQLDTIVLQSHAYQAQQHHSIQEQSDTSASSEQQHVAQITQQSPPQPYLPPPIEIQFTDHRLYATASIIFRNTDHTIVKQMRFIGICGMMWRQLD